MSKKTAIVIVTVFVLLVAGGLLAFYFYTNRGQGSNIAPDENTSSIFPNTGGAGTASPGSSAGNETINTETGTGNSEVAPLLKELSTRPSAGAGFVATTTKALLVRFVEKGTGNVYEVGPEISEESRVTNTTIPKIAEAFWNRDASRFIARYTKAGEPDNIQSYYAQILPPVSGQPDGTIQGSFLTENIKTLATSPDQSRIFYLVTHSQGSTGVTAEFDGSKKTQVFDSPLEEWLSQWATPSTVTLTTKPSAGTPGLMFLLNTKNGSLTKVISGIKGLTTLLNPSGSAVLYSESSQGGLLLKIYSLVKSEPVEVSVQTLPEKCLWSKNEPDILYCAVPYYLPEATYPDAWYQGEVSFSDDIWKIDAATGTGELLARLKPVTRKDIDATNFFMDTKEDYLFFTDKNDSHVWSLRLP